MKKVIALSLAFILAAASCSSAKTTEPEQAEQSKPWQSKTEPTEPVIYGDGDTIVTVGSYGMKDKLTKNHKFIPEGLAVQYVDFTDGYNFNPFYEYDPAREEIVKQELDRDIVKGEVPDILLIDLNDVKRLNRLGALADLGELMDKYDFGIKREDLTDAALEGLTVDGRIPALMKTYSIEMYVAKAKYVPHGYEHWTADDVMEFYEKMPEGMTIMKGDSTEFLRYMLQCEYRSCIDKENATCDFSGKFAEVLQFCKDHPVEPPRWIDTSNMTEEEKRIIAEEAATEVLRDDYLIYRTSMCNKYPEQWLYKEFYYQDMTPVGFPSEDGCGAVVWKGSEPMYLYCISERSTNKEAAWKLLSKMVKTNYNGNDDIVDGPFGISIFKKWTYKDYKRYVAEITGTAAQIIPEEDYERIYDFYSKIPVDIYQDYKVWQIVWEECQPVLNGNRSVEDAVRLLNNRVGLYLSETS